MTVHTITKWVFIIASQLMVLGCVSLTDEEKNEVMHADYGKYPENYKEIIAKHIGKDKLSDGAGVSIPVKNRQQSRGDKKEMLYGYSVCLNLWNYYLIKNDQVIYEFHYTPSGGNMYFDMGYMSGYCQGLESTYDIKIP